MSEQPDTIVLVHGFWVTPRSWEDWIARYESRGFRVLAPAYPGFEVEVEALNADPTPIEKVTVPAIIEHLEAVVGELEAPPILMGQSAGGVFVQILLDHGFGAAGWRSTPRRRRACRWCPCRRSRRRSPCSGTRQPAPRGRVHPRAVALRVHEHVQRGGVASATTSRPPARSSGGARWPTSIRAGTTPT